MIYQSVDAYVGNTHQTFEKPDNIRHRTALEIVGQGVMAGTAGGLAEIAWVTLYTTATGSNPAIIARGVATAAGLSALLPPATVVLGVMIHMGVAIILGVALAFIWRAVSSHRLVNFDPYRVLVAALIDVWGINFFVVLPILSPAFVHLLPYPISFISKLLFGLAAAYVLSCYKSSDFHHADHAVRRAARPDDAIDERRS